jgi:hypothetical protein
MTIAEIDCYLKRNGSKYKYGTVFNRFYENAFYDADEKQ